MRALTRLAAAGLALQVAGCGDMARLPEAAGIGPHPQLPPPARQLVPTVHVAPAQGWPEGVQPEVPPGFRLTALARGLAHPRWLHVLPNGDVLVAETNKPQPPPEEEPRGLRAFIAKQVMKRAGAGVSSADRITLLRDADGDGRAEVRSVFVDKLHSPFGMALVGSDFYVANADGLVRFPYTPGQTRLNAEPARVTELPAGRNHHWTKGLVASPDGRKLYVSVGSNSNAAEGGMAIEEGRAAIWEIDRTTGAKRIYASGLRNPVGIAFEPQTGVLWTVVNERDELGSDLVPDYLTSVREGAFYGWPWSYWGQHVDERVKPPNPQKVAQALEPDYGVGSHVAPLGLAFSDARMPGSFAKGAFIGEHGSWNRKPHSGYKVVFIPFADGKPQGAPADFVTGFLSPQGTAYGRPAGVAIDRTGALLVADDVGNVVWRIAAPRPR